MRKSAMVAAIMALAGMAQPPIADDGRTRSRRTRSRGHGLSLRSSLYVQKDGNSRIDNLLRDKAEAKRARKAARRAASVFDSLES